MSEVQGEDLLAELNRKENDLILAAEFGKKLLDEKERLKQDLSALKADLACLEEVINFSANSDLAS